FHNLYSIFLLISQSPPTSTLFPYTTLFRSFPEQAVSRFIRRANRFPVHFEDGVACPDACLLGGGIRDHIGDVNGLIVDRQVDARSEEHTSELQSRENLVCRLLLEKKKKIDH